jgi:cbb3-type cytochrome c oxidase subunit III
LHLPCLVTAFERAWFAAVIAAAVGGGDSAALARPEAPARVGRKIAIEVRSPASAESRKTVRTLDLDEAKLERLETYDVELGRTAEFFGLRLAPWIEADAPDDVDLALFLFTNGVIIPIPIRDGSLARIDPFVAIAWRTGGGAWDEEFPPVASFARDAPAIFPIVFEGNKLVVRDDWHPYLPNAQLAFSPWRSAATLARIELTNACVQASEITPLPSPSSASMEAKDVARGLAVYLGHCQYCHAVEGKGARLAVDLTQDRVLQEWTPAKLFTALRSRGTGLFEFERRMPPHPDLERSDVADLWAWLLSMKARGGRAYGSTCGG